MSSTHHVTSSSYYDDPRKKSSTHQTASGNTVYQDRQGNSYQPTRSRIDDVHESRSGKSTIIEHHDGISEIRNNETGRTTYQHTQPSSSDSYSRPDRYSSGASSNSTWETPRGTVVHRDTYGNITYPSRSRVDDVHESRSGKSLVVEHRDGINEIHNYETGKTTYARRPESRPDPRWTAPSYAPRHYYDRTTINFNNITINETNIYLRNTNRYFYREPVFYSGYRWQPPVFAPILFTAGMALGALDRVYRPDFPRDTVDNMTGVNYYASEFRSAGVYNSYDLVSAGRTPDDRRDLADRTGIPLDEVRKAVGQADLMRVDGIGPHNSRLLVDAGIDSMQDLARYTWDAESLYEQLKYSSSWNDQQAPTRSDVESWIAQARNLPVAIYDDNVAGY